MWNQERHNCPLGRIKGNIEEWNHTRHPNRALDVVLTRFRLNHTKLNKHLHAKNMKDSPKCQACNLDVDEDVNHVLLHCPASQENRQSMLRNLQDLGIEQASIKDLLGAANLSPKKKLAVTLEVGSFLKKSLRVNEL